MWSCLGQLERAKRCRSPRASQALPSWLCRAPWPLLRCFPAHGKFPFRLQAKRSALAGSCLSPAEPLTAAEGHQQGSGQLNSTLACAAWSVSSAELWRCFSSSPIILATPWYRRVYFPPVSNCVMPSRGPWKGVISKAEMTPSRKRLSFPSSLCRDLRSHFPVELLSERAQPSLIALRWLCAGCTGALRLPKSSLCPL